MTTVFAEYTGNHPALEIDWSAEKRYPQRLPLSETDTASETVDEAPVASEDSDLTASTDVAPVGSVAPSGGPAPAPSFSTFWELARAVNRSDPAALRLAGGAVQSEMPMNGRELRKLLGTFWFRSVFPRLSREWQDHILNVLAEHATIPDHAVRSGRRIVHLHEMTNELRQRTLSDPGIPDAVRNDLQLLAMVARFWGEEALGRFEFAPVPEVADSTRLAGLLQPFRHS